MSRHQRKLLEIGSMVNQYRILRLIGQGGYGDIYECQDQNTNELYAMKVEMKSVTKKALEREKEIMMMLDSPYFPKFITYEETDEMRYIIMELLGASLTAIRRVVEERKFSPSTVLRLGIEMLRAIEAFHQRGILHRDIKASNFLIRASRKYPLTLTDYGLSRIYVDPVTKELIPPRQRPGFVGTSKYASLNAHQGLELGRRDDLMSWLYSLLELWEGQLPWPSTHDKQKMYYTKSGTDIIKEIQKIGMPEELAIIYKLIRRMDRDDEPDYKLLISFMCKAMEKCGASWNDTYEWESLDLTEVSPIELVPPPDDKPIIPTDLPEPKMPPRKVDLIVLPKKK